MTKAEFLWQLEKRLHRLPDFERSRSLTFYSESIDDRMEDGMTEENAVASLGSLDEIVSGILVDTPLTTIIQTRLKESKKKSGNQRMWMILAICSSPFWFPLAIAFAAVLFTVYVCIWVVVLCLFVVAFSLALCGVVGLLAGVALCWTAGFPTGLAVFGAGLSCAGLFLMCFKPIIWMSKQFMGLSVVFARKIKRIFLKEKGAQV